MNNLEEKVEDTIGKTINFDLYKTGVVADLSFSVWGAATKLNPDDLGLDSLPKDKISLGHKRLTKKERLEAINSIRSKSTGVLWQNSFAFPFGTARFIPYARLQQVVEKINLLEKEFYSEVQVFLSGYESDRSQMLLEYETLFEDILSKKFSGEILQVKKNTLLSRLEQKFPSKDELRKKFKFELDLFEVASPEFSKISSGEALEKVELEALYKEKVSQKLDLFLEEVVARLKEMVLNSVKRMKEKAEKDCLTMKTIGSFRKFVEKFKSMDFVDTEIDNSLQILENKLDGIGRSDLNNSNFRNSLSSEIKEFEESVLSVDMDKVLGRFKRNLRVVENS
jgi:hypothetical protein